MIDGAREHGITEMETPDLFYIIAKPNMELNTKEMYEIYDKTGRVSQSSHQNCARIQSDCLKN